MTHCLVIGAGPVGLVTSMLLAADGQGSAGRVALGLLKPFRIPPTELETLRVTHGRRRPARWIEERALEVGADLVVLDGRNGELPASAPLGSTAYEVAWSAPCSVLVVRAPRASSADRAVGDPVRSALERKSRRTRPSLEKDASM
jgi:nucleotide-binding universal stress UspA family protein